MADHQFVGPFGADSPAAVIGEGRRAGAPFDPEEVILATFPAHSWDSAVALFLSAKRDGIARTLGSQHRPTRAHGYWEFPGMVPYLIESAIRLGTVSTTIQGAHKEGPVVEIGRKIGECYNTYKSAKGPQKDDRDFSVQERRHVAALLDSCDRLSERVHAMADATRAAIAGCREAFGMPPRDYRHAIATAGDRAATTTPDAELAEMKAELAEARTDYNRAISARDEAANLLEGERARAERLAAEHAELLDQNRQLAAMIEELTAPVAAPAESAPATDPDDAPAAPAGPPEPTPKPAPPTHPKRR